jgi:RimJ/RimL family protein N-acetyltransferase
MIELCGDHVALRTLERAHCRELWKAYEPTDPLPTEALRPGLSIEGADKWFEEMQAQQGKEQVYLGIFAEGRLVGDIQIAHIEWRHRTASLGLGIARQADRGRGLGTDAARALLCYAFQHLDLYRIDAQTADYNTGMQHVLEKCGFRLEGRQREAIYVRGKRWDRLCYGLLRPEFSAEEPASGIERPADP